MTQDEIIVWAKEFGLQVKPPSWGYSDTHTIGNIYVEHLVAFAKLVAEAEREACAKVCEDLVPTYLKDGERWLKGRNGKPDSRLKDLAPNLEAAWEAEQLLKHGSVVQKITEGHICANAIRARGNT